jgi:hypothetical protein
MYLASLSYLDPRSGSLVIQLILCGICASPFATIIAMIAWLRSHGKKSQAKPTEEN